MLEIPATTLHSASLELFKVSIMLLKSLSTACVQTQSVAMLFADAFLPRVVELARFAGDRQTKVAGCELLHAMVLYAVGTGVQTSAERRAKVRFFLCVAV